MKHSVSVAPMMDCTDRHDRYFLRLISKNVKLYTEMIVANAIIKGDRDFLLKFNLLEKPLSLQIGGSNPKELASAIKKLYLRHAVITSVDRDDLDDGGANHFFEVIKEIRKLNPSTTIEVLTLERQNS